MTRTHANCGGEMEQTDLPEGHVLVVCNRCGKSWDEEKMVEVHEHYTDGELVKMEANGKQIWPSPHTENVMQAQAEHLNKFAEEIGHDVNAPTFKNGEVPSPQTESDWPKEFDEKFKMLWNYERYDGEVNDIKSFISQTLQKQREEMVADLTKLSQKDTGYENVAFQQVHRTALAQGISLIQSKE